MPPFSETTIEAVEQSLGAQLNYASKRYFGFNTVVDDRNTQKTETKTKTKTIPYEFILQEIHLRKRKAVFINLL